MNTFGIIYLVGFILSLGYFLAEQHVERKKQKLPLSKQAVLIAVVISLIYPISWLVIALDALGVDFDKHGL